MLQDPRGRAIGMATKRSCTDRQLRATEAKRFKPRLVHEAPPERRAGLLGGRSGVDARRSRSVAVGQARASQTARRAGSLRKAPRRLDGVAGVRPALHPDRRFRSTASLRSRLGSTGEDNSSSSRSTSFIVCVPSSVTELAGVLTVLAKPHKNHPVARYLTRYAAARKLSASTTPEGSDHDA
jgi:hypothetical protein